MPNKFVLLLLTFLMGYNLALAGNRCRKFLKDQNLTKSAFYFTSKNLTSNEELALAKFKISEPGNFNSFGKVDGIGAKIKSFLFNKVKSRDLPSNEIISAAIDRIVHQVLMDQTAEAAWVTIRITKANSNFDIPRWHTDGRFFETLLPTYKYGQTLKGPPTLLIEIPDSVREEFNRITYDENLSDQSKRKMIAELLKPFSSQVPDSNQGLYFLVGDPSLAAIHSEPLMDGDRIFISIVTGTLEEIESLAKRWKVGGH